MKKIKFNNLTYSKGVRIYLISVTTIAAFVELVIEDDKANYVPIIYMFSTFVPFGFIYVTSLISVSSLIKNSYPHFYKTNHNGFSATLGGNVFFKKKIINELGDGEVIQKASIIRVSIYAVAVSFVCFGLLGLLMFL